MRETLGVKDMSVKGMDVDVAELATAAGIGFIAGVRSMTAPAAVVWAINRNWVNAPSGRLSNLKSKKAAYIVTAMAAGEMVVDKLPGVPDRTAPPSLAFRAVSGALSAALLCRGGKLPLAWCAVAGAIGAVAGSFAGLSGRRQLQERLPDTAAALAEDAMAIAAGGWLVSRAA